MDLLNGMYRITQKLGKGGFGSVYLADYVQAGKQVAIKALHTNDEQAASNIIHEMQQLAKLNHPSVVAFYHHFIHDNTTFLVMEYCKGGSLYSKMLKKGLDPIKVFQWGIEIAEVMSYIHNKGICHRDIKPANILFTETGNIKIGDFGVANRNLGTLVYLPPECFLDENLPPTDVRVDIYCLGITLLELIVGYHPFANVSSNDLVLKKIKGDVVPSHFPLWVQEIILKAIHSVPEVRFQTMQEFKEAMESKSVPSFVNKKRIISHKVTEKTERAIKQKKWLTAYKWLEQALHADPEYVPALIAAGRYYLRLRKLDQAQQYFDKALQHNPRANVQKELGSIHLEKGKYSQAISMLNDHLQRNGVDLEAYNLLLCCYYLTNRYELGIELATLMINMNKHKLCFINNKLLCEILAESYEPAPKDKYSNYVDIDPFIEYNRQFLLHVFKTINQKQNKYLKSKLLFKEIRYDSNQYNTIIVENKQGNRREYTKNILTIGRNANNFIRILDNSVSRHHCAIINYPNDVWVYDLSSTIGTYIDGKRVNKKVHLNGVHELKIGDSKLKISARGDILI